MMDDGVDKGSRSKLLIYFYTCDSSSQATLSHNSMVKADRSPYSSGEISFHQLAGISVTNRISTRDLMDLKPYFQGSCDCNVHQIRKTADIIKEKHKMCVCSYKKKVKHCDDPKCPAYPTHSQPDGCPGLGRQRLLVLTHGDEPEVVPGLAYGEALHVRPRSAGIQATRVPEKRMQY